MKTKTTLLILLHIAGCEITDIDYDTYTIKNETDYNVTILAYDKYYYSGEQIHKVDTPYLSDSIVIPNHDKYLIKKRTGEDNDPRGHFKNAGVDSVIISFENQKRLIYVCPYTYCDEPRNIIVYRLSSTKTCEKNRGCDYTYTITQEDYENAQQY